MIKIYCLVNPLTGLPFYVGATKHRLSARISRHCSDNSRICTPDDSHSYNKAVLFKQLKDMGLRPIIMLLFTTNKENVDICEKYFYNLFISQGIDLLQTNYNFLYDKKINKK